MRRASSATTVDATASPRRAAAKTEGASYGGASDVSLGRSPASRSASSDSALAHGSKSCVPGACVIQLAGCAVVAAMDLAA